MYLFYSFIQIGVTIFSSLHCINDILQIMRINELFQFNFMCCFVFLSLNYLFIYLTIPEKESPWSSILNTHTFKYKLAEIIAYSCTWTRTCFEMLFLIHTCSMLIHSFNRSSTCCLYAVKENTFVCEKVNTNSRRLHVSSREKRYAAAICYVSIPRENE